jgi:outer membrane protein OmpA-like peptidoglycan-associated protein
MVRNLLLASALAVTICPSAAHACASPIADFAFGSAQLNSQAHKEIADIANYLTTNPNEHVNLVAQIDGSNANARMARRRVKVVSTEFKRLGVSARKIHAQFQTIEYSSSSARLIRLEVVATHFCD